VKLDEYTDKSVIAASYLIRVYRGFRHYMVYLPIFFILNLLFYLYDFNHIVKSLQDWRDDEVREKYFPLRLYIKPTLPWMHSSHKQINYCLREVTTCASVPFTSFQLESCQYYRGFLGRVYYSDVWIVSCDKCFAAFYQHVVLALTRMCSKLILMGIDKYYLKAINQLCLRALKFMILWKIVGSFMKSLLEYWFWAVTESTLR
jgi:hypothetical protein